MSADNVMIRDYIDLKDDSMCAVAFERVREIFQQSFGVPFTGTSHVSNTVVRKAVETMYGYKLNSLTRMNLSHFVKRYLSSDTSHVASYSIRLPYAVCVVLQDVQSGAWAVAR